MAIMQEGNIYLHFKDGDTTVLYIEAKPIETEQEEKFIRNLIEAFFKKLKEKNKQ